MDILRAYKIACQLHAGQTDKAGRPYIEHLTRVMLRVQMDGGDRFQQIAALLHDSIEDEKTTADELLALGVPSEAVVLVQALTKREEQSYEDYLRGLIGRYRVVTVKMADLDDNSDPERLELLPERQRMRLQAKYAQAWDILHGG
jgi:(p)ppGpp synthase/HD superfamily hydrolase